MAELHLGLHLSPGRFPSLPSWGSGGGVRQGLRTWLNHHTQPVEWVLLTGDVHVLTEKGPARGSFQAGVGSAWAEGTRGPKTRQHIKPAGLLPPGGHKKKGQSLRSLPTPPGDPRTEWACAPTPWASQGLVSSGCGSLPGRKMWSHTLSSHSDLSLSTHFY